MYEDTCINNRYKEIQNYIYIYTYIYIYICRYVCVCVWVCVYKDWLKSSLADLDDPLEFDQISFIFLCSHLSVTNTSSIRYCCHWILLVKKKSTAYYIIICTFQHTLIQRAISIHMTHTHTHTHTHIYIYEWSLITICMNTSESKRICLHTLSVGKSCW